MTNSVKNYDEQKDVVPFKQIFEVLKFSKKFMAVIVSRSFLDGG